MLIDRDGTGQVELRELGRALEQMGMKVNEQEVERLYRQMDTDGDGQVSKEEFANFGRLLVSENRDVSGASKKHTIAEKKIEREILNPQERRDRARAVREAEELKKRAEVHTSPVHRPSSFLALFLLLLWSTTHALLSLIGFTTGAGAAAGVGRAAGVCGGGSGGI